nr:caspase-8-like [Labrus bergylta]
MMSAKDTMRRNKTLLQSTLCGDNVLILNKVFEKKLITEREYNNLKSINKEDVEGHVIKLVDKIMNKGDETCQDFLHLLQTDEDIKTTYPKLKNIQLSVTRSLPLPIQASSSNEGDMMPPESKRPKQDDQYQLNSQPNGLCVIINNETFMDGKVRRGTNNDAESLAKVFSWLNFRVLMCKDQTKDQMVQTLTCFASLRDLSQLQQLDVKEWSNDVFTDLQGDPQHGDAFICCVLSHGTKGVVSGIDSKSLSIQETITTFKATGKSPLTGKPKVFLIQACQGRQMQRGVLSEDLQADDSQSPFIPEDADFLVALATVEDYKAMRHPIDGSWFIQSLCEQLKERCPRGEDITTILHHVNNQVSLKEGFIQHDRAKQMPEVRFTLRKRLVLSPQAGSP